MRKGSGVFPGPVGPSDAKICLVYGIPTGEDHKERRHLSGALGNVLDRALGAAGLQRSDLLIIPVVAHHPNSGSEFRYFEDKARMIPTKEFRAKLGILTEHLRRAKPNIIIAMGDFAFSALCHEKGLSRKRGSLYTCKLDHSLLKTNVIPMTHPGDVMRKWELLQPTIMDLRKAKEQSAFAGTKEENLDLRINASVDEFEAYAEYLATSPEVEHITFDIESTYCGWHAVPTEGKEDPAARIAYLQYLEDQVTSVTGEVGAETQALVAAAVEGERVEKKKARALLRKQHGFAAAVWNGAEKLWKRAIKLHYKKKLTYANGHMTWFGVGHSSEMAMNIRLLRTVGDPKLEAKVPEHSAEDELRIFRAIAKIFDAKGKKFIAQNGQFDASFLWKHHGILCPLLWFDTMIAGHVLWTGLPKNLAFLSSMLLTSPAWKHTSKQNMGMYNALDVVRTHQLAMKMSTLLDEQGVRGTFDMEMRELEVATFLGLRGIAVDLPQQRAMAGEYKASLHVKKLALDSAVGHSRINYGSPKQLSELLYTELGFPLMLKRKKSRDEKDTTTTDDEALKKLSRKFDSPIPKMILAWRKDKKMLSNYLTNRACPETGRHYTTYGVAGTDTGRWNSSASIISPFGPGNLQNIPKIARKIYIPAPGKVIIQADYSMAEAVAVAYLSGDKKLQKQLEDPDFDIHKDTVAGMYCRPVESITKGERVIGKRVRHAGNYAGGPSMIANALGISLGKAKEYGELFHRANPFLGAWHDRIKRELRQTMTLTTPLGRKRKFYERWGDGLFRSAYAFKPQSTIGDLMNMSIVSFYDTYGSMWNVMLQLHDAVYVEAPESEKEQAAAALLACMTRVIYIDGEKMTLRVDFSFGQNWAEMKDWTPECAKALYA